MVLQEFQKTALARQSFGYTRGVPAKVLRYISGEDEPESARTIKEKLVKTKPPAPPKAQPAVDDVVDDLPKSPMKDLDGIAMKGQGMDKAKKHKVAQLSPNSKQLLDKLMSSGSGVRGFSGQGVRGFSGTGQKQEFFSHSPEV